MEYIESDSWSLTMQQKVEERVGVHSQSELQEKDWDFLFLFHYQSTDESKDEDSMGIDSATDDEQEVKTKAKRKAPSKLPWITRRPAYRANVVSSYHHCCLEK